MFQWLGIGTYAFEAILQSTIRASWASTVYAGAIFMLANLLVDIAHGIIDRVAGRDGSRLRAAPPRP